MAKSRVRTIRGKNPASWSRRFDDPITLPDGSELKTLREAIAYLARTVPKAEQAMPEVLAAAETLTTCGRTRDRMDVPGAHRRAAGDPSQHAPRVQSRSERHPLGKAEAEAG